MVHVGPSLGPLRSEGPPDLIRSQVSLSDTWRAGVGYQVLRDDQEGVVAEEVAHAEGPGAGQGGEGAGAWQETGGDRQRGRDL